ncbi:hypothetical protein, conserved [Plasmodium gonderi]|uniref:Uncharacterized protein n=1 Tax=Plasmodium gonderi TaxID=77519 RepID=A0A1Y1JIR3_PLAGO|nr:hypothetical protein, conserved [Plasmodium gonderi]GAW82386.1 hypothetical protein, conserved [Plasmodium gonderi]
MNKLKEEKKKSVNPDYSPKKIALGPLFIVPPVLMFFSLSIFPFLAEKRDVNNIKKNTNKSSNFICDRNSYVKTCKNTIAGENDNIINKIKELNLLLLQNKDEINILQQENETFSSQVANFVKKCKELQCMISAREKDIAKLKENEKYLVQELNKRDNEKGELELHIKELLQGKESKKAHISDVENKISILKNELDAKCLEINILNDNVKKLEERIILLQNESTKTKQDVINNLKRQDQINEQTNLKDNKIFELDEKTKKLNKIIKDKIEENENLKKKIQQQTSKITYLNEKIQTFEKDQKNDKDKIKKYLETIKNLKKVNSKKDEQSKESKMQDQRKEHEDIVFNSQIYNFSKKKDKHKQIANNSKNHKSGRNTNEQSSNSLSFRDTLNVKNELDCGSNTSSSYSESSDEEIVSFSSKYKLSKNMNNTGDKNVKNK